MDMKCTVHNTWPPGNYVAQTGEKLFKEAWATGISISQCERLHYASFKDLM